MKVAFKHEATSAYGHIIQAWTFGPYCHVELVFSNGDWFSARDMAGTAFSHSCPEKEEYYTILEVPVSTEDEGRIRKFCIDELGCPYDCIGIAFSFLPIPLGYQSHEKWFCSEVCVAALQLAGYFKGYTPSRISPNKMYKLLMEELAERIK